MSPIGQSLTLKMAEESKNAWLSALQPLRFDLEDGATDVISGSQHIRTSQDREMGEMDRSFQHPKPAFLGPSGSQNKRLLAFWK